MKLYKLAYSTDAPSQKDCVWAKPTSEGFVLYLPENGTWRPLKNIDDNNTPQTSDGAYKDAILGVKVNNSKLTPSSKKEVNIKIETGATTGCVKVNGSDVAVKGLVGKGTFANKPEEPAIGDMYFCTDKQTTEGAADGIAIFYNGTNWVDALGRTVS